MKKTFSLYFKIIPQGGISILTLQGESEGPGKRLAKRGALKVNSFTIFAGRTPETVALKNAGHKTRSVSDLQNITNRYVIKQAVQRRNEYLSRQSVT
jgi:hypothetical protein